jgi:lysophospholipase L1-like esterase
MNLADIGPFWMSRLMRRESLLFIAEPDREPAAATLLFSPDGALALTGADGLSAYAEGSDYTVDRAAGRIHLTPGSPVPFVRREELQSSTDRDGSGFMHVRGDSTRFLLFAEGDAFHRRQTSATYAHALGAWWGNVPVFGGAALPQTLARLTRHAPVTVCVTGDSIAEGYNASGFVGAPPRQPPFADLVAAGLEQAYGSPVTLRNFAQTGSSSSAGLDMVECIAAEQPHLAVVAFGMNDAGYMAAAEFGDNIGALMASVRRRAPATEFILVSPMLPHPDWHYTPIERFAAYRDTLASLCGEGTVLADLTTLWTDLLARKSVYDLTGNGINHPNDFGHRLYAQVILSLLVDEAFWRIAAADTTS